MSVPPDRLPLSDLGQPFYEGSVQRLYAVPGDDTLMVTETTARGSVFDVGALFELPGNDVNRALFRHVLYARLGQPGTWARVAQAIREEPGLEGSCRADLLEGPLEDWTSRGARTHHEGMIDALTGEVARDQPPSHPSACNLVRRYQILKPERVCVLGAHLFDYSRYPAADGFVVPLEYIVRFGITSASSVYRGYLAMDAAARAAFEAELGVSRPLQPWQVLERPVIDFTTKFEPQDRMLSKQEALACSGLSGAQFLRGAKAAVLGAWAVRLLVEEMGLRLWDIKWEFARDGGELVFVDTIDTDSFRATLLLESGGRRFASHCNKQAIRDYFLIRHGDWIAAIREAKARGAAEGRDFTGLLRAGQAAGAYPPTPEVDPAFIAIQQRKLDAIRRHLLGLAEGGAANQALREAGLDEIEYYRAAGKLEDFARLNGIG